MGKRKLKKDRAPKVAKQQQTATTTQPASKPFVLENCKSWHEIPNDIQCRRDVAKMAIDKKWIKHVTELPMQLQQDKSFRRYCIIRGFKQRYINKTRTTYLDCDYDELSEQWKKDHDVIRAAFKYERATLKDIPESFVSFDDDYDEYCSNDEFLRDIVREYPHFYSELPPNIRDDLEYWLDEFTSEWLLEEIIKAQPTECDEPQFWCWILDGDFGVDAKKAWMDQYAPPHMWLDHDFMWAVMQDQELFWLVDNSRLLPILQDKEFVRMSFLRMEYDHLFSISEETQLAFPDLMAKIVIPRILKEGDEQETFATNAMAPELWNDFDIVEAWFSNFGHFVEDAMPQIWNLDPKEFLVIAEKGCVDTAIECFQRAPTTLLDDKSFMMQAVELQPYLYETASAHLKDDIDLRMVLCSKVSSMDGLLWCGMSAADVKRTHEYVQERYNTYQSFETFRSCVSHHGNTTRAPIMLLNQGLTTTSIAYNSLLADYLGAPTGDELEMVQKCAEKIGNV